LTEGTSSAKKIVFVKQWRTTWQFVGDALQLGLSIVLAIFIGLLIGWWLDDRLGTSPYLTIIFFLLGIGAAGTNVWRAVRRELNRDKAERNQ
jgi:F0F1-type ATP synthase assembly protein I